MKTPEALANAWIEEYGLEAALLRVRGKLQTLNDAPPSFLDYWRKVEAVVQTHQKCFLGEAILVHLDAKPADGCPGCGRHGSECWASPCLYLEFVKVRPLTELRAWCKITGGTLVSRKDAQPEGR